MIVELTLILIIAIIILLAWHFYNRFVRLENRVDNSWAQVDVQLKRRADLIPNLLETVKGYMTHEREVLERVTEARASIMRPGSRQENIDADNMLSSTLKSLFAVAENYPDLKANRNFLNLQDELTHTEDKIAYAKQHYNDSVLGFNNAIETFPGVLFARMYNKTEALMLSTAPQDREVPRISFGDDDRTVRE